MKKRLRKKRRLREFADWCFELDATFEPPLNDQQLNELCDRMIDEVETAGLQFGGGGNLQTWNAIVQFGERQPTEADRTHFKRWFTSQPQVSNCRTGPLREANFGWSD